MKKMIWSALAVALLPGGAWAQTPAAPPAPAAAQAPAPAPDPEPVKRVTLTTGIDFPTAYLFRGIMQQNRGFITQPYVDVGFALDNGVSVNVGNWNSIHQKAPDGHWYEADYYATVNFTTGKVKPGVLYTAYTSPADNFSTVHELAGVVAFDDSANRVPFAPKATLAFELSDASADGGDNKGIYLELAGKPGLPVFAKTTLYVPLKLGLSVKDYYEGPTGSNFFGYFDFGAQLSVAALSGKGGALEIHGGIDFVVLGDNLKLLNDDNRVKPVGLIGFTYTY